MSIAILYRADHKAIKKAWHDYLIEEESYWNNKAPTKEWMNKQKIPLNLKGWLSEEDVRIIMTSNTRWLYSYDTTDFFKPFCAWCHFKRDPLGDDNEHEECDACLEELAEIARVETDSSYNAFIKSIPIITLGACQPDLPSAVLDKIASFIVK
jgi:hypothetical protein